MQRLASSLLVLLVVLLLSATAATAQTTFRLGLRGGASRAITTLAAASNTNQNFYNISAEKTAIYSWQAGVVAEIARGKWAVQPALLFSQKGEQLNTAISSRDAGFPYSVSQTSTTRTNWLELPLNIVYTLHGDHGLQLFAGPYVALGVGGRERGTRYSAHPSVRYAPYDFDEQVSYGAATNNRRLDAGVNGGVGYRQGPVQVQLGYGLGLRNLHQDNPSQAADYIHSFAADAAYHRVAQLTGTYFFGL